ncbi:endonuclease III [archaeon]|jgi:endonuclease-3|nr:endonuclease III [archaeon]MBT4021793.1 endonuclease III [archaeon]MBT4271792.1 endonuclease III [archaeon]MBT4460513.1 endonuclease III [archaeon]MBT4858533.1 endonuclease III [archaeon]
MQAIEVYSILKKQYPKSKIALNHSNPLELLIAVMLSAQCTDIRVNIVTKNLFAKYQTIEEYANSDIDELKKIIRSAGFYNNKAKNIINTCKIIIDKHNGLVPKTMDELVFLPGVARKTANIVLSNAFNITKGIAIDTHMKRINFRLNLTKNIDPNKIEQDLMKQLPQNLWNKYTYVIIEHGRAVCKAPTPLCSKCILNNKCSKKGVSRYK